MVIGVALIGVVVACIIVFDEARLGQCLVVNRQLIHGFKDGRPDVRHKGSLLEKHQEKHHDGRGTHAAFADEANLHVCVRKSKVGDKQPASKGLTRMLAARHSASAVMTKKSNTGLVKLQNLASAVTRIKVQRFNTNTAVAQPLSSSMMHRIRVRIITARYSKTLK